MSENNNETKPTKSRYLATLKKIPEYLKGLLSSPRKGALMNGGLKKTKLLNR